jgi:SAM-dependent methyltransferase
MTRPVLDPAYWRKRLEQANKFGMLHQAIYKCVPDLWEAIEQRHRSLLREIIQDEDSVLDVGCGYGRLLDLMPPSWKGEYVGVDISPDFIQLAKSYRFKAFFNMDVRELKVEKGHFDWAIMLSFRPMIRENLGEQVWEEMERVIRHSAKRLLYLEVHLEHGGSVE